MPDRLDVSVAFDLRRRSIVRALAGWFEAVLAPEIVLSSAPGRETHWGQILFPIPPVVLEAGDTVTVRLRFEGDTWFWSGRAGQTSFERSSDQWEAPEGKPDDTLILPTESTESMQGKTITERNERGGEAFLAGDLAGALDCYRSAIRALGPGDDTLARPLYENLGLTLFNLHHPRAAASCFLRAMDGDPTRRPQSAKYLSEALEQLGDVLGAERLRALVKAPLDPESG